MERDRRFDDRDRDRHPSGGQSYKPSSGPRSPVRGGETFRPGRSPQRGPPNDNYSRPGNSRMDQRPRSRSPGRFRRRSRSPGYRGRERSPGPTSNNWRARERSGGRAGRWSPKRDFNRRDDRPRSPYRGRYRSRSPYNGPRNFPPRGDRPRSPLPLKRGREPSPVDDRAMRSPPPAKRERVRSPIRDDRRRSPPAGPRGSYRPRSRSPPRRDDRFVAQDSRGWGGRSPSPPPRGAHADDRLEPISGQVSAATSRRSSPPPVHSNRSALQENEVGPLDRAPQTWGARRLRSPLPPQASTRSPYRARSPPPEKREYIDREPSPGRRGYSPRARSPPRGPSNNRSPIPRRDEEYNRNGSYDDRDSGAAQWGGSGRGSHNGYGRGGPPNGPPSGPSRHYSGSAGMSPPAGPASAPVSMSAHNRQGNVSVLSAPRQPRGDPGRGSIGRENSYPGPPSGGYRRGPPPIHTRGSHHGGSAGSTPTSATSGGPPTGPRGGFAPPFRSNNSTSTTYPRTQRFNNHTAGMPQIVAGGKLLPAYEISDKLAKLEADKKRLEEALAEKEAKKRAAIREWDRLERESAREGYKTELADKHVKALAGEGGMDGDAF